MHDEFETPASKSGNLLANRWVMTGMVALVVVGGASVAAAVAQDAPGRFGMGGPGMQGMTHHAAFGFGGGHRFGRVLDRIDATPEQEEKIWAIVDKARAEMRPVMREFRGSREEIAELLGAATIDKAAVEALRAERMAQLDEASKKMTATIVEAAEVLTPEQRAELIEHFKERKSHRRW